MTSKTTQLNAHHSTRRAYQRYFISMMMYSADELLARCQTHKVLVPKRAPKFKLAKALVDHLLTGEAK